MYRCIQIVCAQSTKKEDVRALEVRPFFNCTILLESTEDRIARASADSSIEPSQYC